MRKPWINRIPFAFAIALAASAASAQWTEHSSPITAGIYSLYVKDGAIYAGTDGQGAFRSKDRGETWEPLNAGFPERPGVYRFAEFGGRFFAGTYDGVYYSADHGETWTRSNHQGWSYLHVVDMAANGRFLFATSNREFKYPYNFGIFRSADSGLTWTKVINGFTATIWINTLESHRNALYVGTSGEGIFRSADDGETWVPYNKGLPAGLDFDPRYFFSHGDRLYVGTDNGVYVLAGESDTWKRISKGFPDDYLITSFAAYGTHLFAGASPMNGGGVWHSADQGATWRRISKPESNPWQVASLAVLGDELFASTGENVCGELGCGGSVGGIWKASIPGLLGITPINPRAPEAGRTLRGKTVWEKVAEPGRRIRFESTGPSRIGLKARDAMGKRVGSR